MKKYLLLIMVILLAFTIALPGTAGADARPSLVVGQTTRMSGNFLMDAWGTNTADLDVRSLIHDYYTIAWTGGGDYLVNGTVVQEMREQRDPDGHLTHVITLHRDLRYNNGAPIAARDYVFSLLLANAPQLNVLGVIPVMHQHIRGHQAYSQGLSPIFSGVSLIDEYTFALTIDAASLPYYYGAEYANVQPLPIAVIAPGCEVRDDGQGAYLHGDMTGELLGQTILDPVSGYLSHPRMTSGPYSLVSYDDQAHVASFERNPYYKGNHEGRVPAIERIVFREIENAQIADQLRRGEVHLVNKVTDGAVIEQIEQLSIESKVSFSQYQRAGGAFLAMASEQPIISSPNMRRAIAASVDYDLLPREFLQGHGKRIYAYYGLGQWMPKQTAADQLSYGSPFQADLAAAARWMEADGWTLNAQGAPFDPQTDTHRYRKAGDRLEPLILRMAVTQGNRAAEMLADMLEKNLAQNGARLLLTQMDLSTLLRQHYRQDERQVDLYFLGMNFTYFFDPTFTYHPDLAFQGSQNTSGLQDDELYQLALNLRETRQGDSQAYFNNWMSFQRRWIELVPLIPLYSNDYYDAYSTGLTGYRPAEHWNWANAILYADFTQ